MKNPGLLLAIPICFVVVTILGALLSKKKSNFILRLASGLMLAGPATGALEFFILAPLLVKGTDGPGGLIAIILPVVTILFSTVLAAILMSIGGMASALKIQNKTRTELSPEASAILNGHPDFMGPLLPAPVSTNWRDFAKPKF
jgi:hypothetical protein